MKFKAVIFDLDGTIIDTMPIWKAAIQEFLKEHDISYSPESESKIFEDFFGMDMHTSCQRAVKQFSLSYTPDQLIHKLSALAQKLYAHHVTFVNGFTNFEHEVKQEHLKSAIASNAQDQLLNIVNKTLNLKQFFGDHIYGLSAVNNRAKPDPALFNYTAAQLQVEPTACIVIEDSRHGIVAAKAAHMFCIGLNTAKNRSLLADADIIVDHYSEINLKNLL